MRCEELNNCDICNTLYKYDPERWGQLTWFRAKQHLDSLSRCPCLEDLNLENDEFAKVCINLFLIMPMLKLNFLCSARLFRFRKVWTATRSGTGAAYPGGRTWWCLRGRSPRSGTGCSWSRGPACPCAAPPFAAPLSSVRGVTSETRRARRRVPALHSEQNRLIFI